MSDFVAALEAQRTASKASDGSSTKQKKSLNTSTSDVVAQVRSFVLDQAHHQVADPVQARLTRATQALQSSGDEGKFKADVEKLIHDARGVMTPNAMGASYDKAQQLGEYADAETQDAILHLMDQAKDLFGDILSNIINFLKYASQNVSEWRQEASDKMKAFFSKVSAFIDAFPPETGNESLIGGVGGTSALPTEPERTANDGRTVDPWC